VSTLIVVLGGAALSNTHLSNKKILDQQQKAEDKHTQDQNQIIGLKTAVETATKDQDNNTKQFVLSFSQLSDRLNGLQTELKTAGLQKEAEQLRVDLAATRHALIPQQVELIASLEDLGVSLDGVAVKEKSVDMAADGNLSFNLIVANTSERCFKQRQGHICP
jgi:hypothetical protein